MTSSYYNNTIGELLCPQIVENEVHFIFYMFISFIVIGWLLVPGMLIFVARRAKSIVKDREENYFFYRNIDDKRESLSGLSNSSMVSEEDRRDSLRNDYQVLPDEYLLDHENPQASYKRSRSITFKSNVEVNYDSTEKANKTADQFLQAIFNPKMFQGGDKSSDESIVDGGVGISNLIEDVLRISGSVATVSSQRSNVRGRRDSMSQQNITHNRRGSLLNYDGNRRRKTVAFNPTLEVNNYSSQKESQSSFHDLSTI